MQALEYLHHPRCLRARLRALVSHSEHLAHRAQSAALFAFAAADVGVERAGEVERHADRVRIEVGFCRRHRLEVDRGLGGADQPVVETKLRQATEDDGLRFLPTLPIGARQRGDHAVRHGRALSFQGGGDLQRPVSRLLSID